jgi:thiol-disulfide isomerase/thioredoxin
MKKLAVLLSFFVAGPLFAASPAEQQLVDAIKAPNLSVVHLWAPWCSNCQAELKSGGWLKTVKANPQVKFYFVSVWNGGEDGRAMLAKYELANQANVTIQDQALPRYAPELDPDDLGLQRGRSSLRSQLRRGPV